MQLSRDCILWDILHPDIHHRPKQDSQSYMTINIHADKDIHIHIRDIVIAVHRLYCRPIVHFHLSFRLNSIAPSPDAISQFAIETYIYIRIRICRTIHIYILD